MNTTLIKCRKCGKDIEQSGLKTLCPECRHESHMGSLKVDTIKVINTVKRNPCATLQQVADKYGISRERVRQIISTAHVTRIIKQRNHYVCLNCGKVINGQGKKFCNRQCIYEYTHPLVECYNCHKLFKTRKSSLIYCLNNNQSNGETKKHLFCSQHCKGVFAGINYGFKVHPENMQPPKRKWDYSKIYELRDKGLSYSEITSELGIHGGTISTILNPRKRRVVT